MVEPDNKEERKAKKATSPLPWYSQPTVISTVIGTVAERTAFSSFLPSFGSVYSCASCVWMAHLPPASAECDSVEKEKPTVPGTAGETFTASRGESQPPSYG